jgi:hypothetical protein
MSYRTEYVLARMSELSSLFGYEWFIFDIQNATVVILFVT